MRECSRHPSESQPGGGVCARCLEERLLWLWKGESFRQQQLPQVSVASVRQQLQVHGVASAGVSTQHHHHHHATSDGDGAAAAGLERVDNVMEEWSEFHARRRREQDSSSKTKSLDEADVDTELVVLMNAQKMRSRSMPLDVRSAEDTAQRVINELQADDLFFDDDELDAYAHLQETHRDYGDDEGGVELEAPQQQRCFSPKWVKVLTASSRNRVFPSSRSKEDARKGRGSRKRGGAARFDSSDWGVKHWPPRPTMRSSVFSWLQDTDATYQTKCEQRELSSSCSSTDSWLRDLTTVGHLHEIAEELEIEEEELEDDDEDEDEEEVVSDMSFGKFLLSAAQRQPEAHLTRLVSAHSK